MNRLVIVVFAVFLALLPVLGVATPAYAQDPRDPNLVYIELRPDLDESGIAKKAHIPTNITGVGIWSGYSLPVWTPDSNEELFLLMCVPDRWNESSDILVHIKTATTDNETGNVYELELAWAKVTPDVVEALPAGVSENVTVTRTVDSGLTYACYLDWFVLDYDVEADDPIDDDDTIALRLRRFGDSDNLTTELIVFEIAVLFARGDLLAEEEGMTESLFLLAFIVLAVGLMIGCYAFKKMVLGFGAAGGWLILGFYCRGLVEDLGDLYLNLALFCWGLAIVSVFEAMGQRGKKEIGDDYEVDDSVVEEEKEVDAMIAEQEAQQRPAKKLRDYFDKNKKGKKKNKASMRKIARKEARRAVEQGD